MKILIAVLLFVAAVVSHAGEFKSSLLVQTGQMREGDLIVRVITDLEAKKTCLAFYVRTAGTSPVVHCYEATSGLGATLSQVGAIKSDDLVIRKLEDTKNNMSCLAAYVSTPGTSPSVSCYLNKQRFKDHMLEAGHLREGDLEVRRIVDPGNLKTCLVAYVKTKGTSPSIKCYESPTIAARGALHQGGNLKAGDLVVRKIIDTANRKACLVTYVSTAGTSSNMFCFDE